MPDVSALYALCVMGLGRDTGQELTLMVAVMAHGGGRIGGNLRDSSPHF